MCWRECVIAPPAVWHATAVPAMSCLAAVTAMLPRAVTSALIDGSASARHACNCADIGIEAAELTGELAAAAAAVIVCALDKLWWAHIANAAMITTSMASLAATISSLGSYRLEPACLAFESESLSGEISAGARWLVIAMVNSLSLRG